MNTGLNVVLLQQVVAAIEQHPERYNPAFYRDLDVDPVTFDLAGWTAEVVGMPWCEGELSEFCLEGPCGDPIAVDFWAAEALGLNAEQSSKMFRELYEDPYAALDYARTLIMQTMEVWTDV